MTLAELGAPPEHPVPRQRDLLDAARRDSRGGLGAVADARRRAVLARALTEDPAARPSAAEAHASLEVLASTKRRFSLAMSLS